MEDRRAPKDPDCNVGLGQKQQLEEPLFEQIADRKGSIQFEDGFDDEEEPEKEPLTCKTVVENGLMMIGALVVFWICFRFLAEPIMRLINHSLGWLVRDPGMVRGSVLILIGIPFTWFFFPGLTTVNVLQAFLMKSFWLSFLISFLRVWLTSMGIFYLVKQYFRSKIVDKFKKKLLFQVLYLEIKNRPYQIGVMFSFLFVPVAVKNYLMSLTSLHLKQFSLIIIPSNFIYCMMWTFVGYSINDIGEVGKHKPFNEKRAVEKFQTILSYVMFALSAVCMCFLVYYIQKKYKQLENEHKIRVQSRQRELQVLEAGPQANADKLQA